MNKQQYKNYRATYLLFRRTTGEPFYVGESANIASRVLSHANCIGPSTLKVDLIKAEARAGGEIIIVPICYTRTKTESQGMESMFRFLLGRAGYTIVNKIIHEDRAYKWIGSINHLVMTKQGLALIGTLCDTMTHPLLDCVVELIQDTVVSESVSVPAYLPM